MQRIAWMAAPLAAAREMPSATGGLRAERDDNGNAAVELALSRGPGPTA